jgi:hypothetical protein
MFLKKHFIKNSTSTNGHDSKVIKMTLNKPTRHVQCLEVKKVVKYYENIRTFIKTNKTNVVLPSSVTQTLVLKLIPLSNLPFGL